MAKLNSILVIGGGIAGIQASLDLADQGYKVYLVEKMPSIGGRMAQLDKTFPTNDCSMCMLAPKVVTCGRHPNIELLTYSEVKEVKGKAGDFTVRIERKPRYVSGEKCTGCGLCMQVCPIKVPNEFDQGLGARSAIYVPFPQAVPLVYTIDREHCIQCSMCKIVCGPNAVDYNMPPEEIEVKVGSVIVAIGYDVYEPYDLTEYGYGIYPDVITALEFERLLNASGPTGGHLIRPSDGKKVRKLAFIQCVGSRSSAQGRPYCSRFCCTHATKEAIIAKEHEKDIEPFIFYNDMRTFGKGFEEYRQRASDEYGIGYIKGIPGEIQQASKGSLIVRYEDQKERKVKEMEVDMAVLSTAAMPKKGIEELAEKLGIEIDKYGFIKELDHDINPVDTSKPGIYACGVATAPRDIPDSVAQASGAAVRASMYAEPAEMEEEITEEIDVSGREPRIGVFVCHCGINIGGVVDVPSVAEYAATLPNVVHAERNLYTCSADALKRIQEKIKEHDLNRVVVASCTPRTHEPLFRATCEEVGLNKYLFEMANIRDQCSWVHMHEHEKATDKAKDLVRMAVAKAGLLEPLYEKEIDINPSSLVIGAGIAGMTVALNIAKHGFKVYLVEKGKEVGGLLRGMHRVFPEDKKASELLDPIIRKVEENENIELLTLTTVKDVKGYIGNFEATLSKGGKEERITVGTIVVATGAKPFEPEGYYGYGKYKNVITQSELDKLIAENKLNAPKNIVMIQCVGAREKEGRTYCSRACCMAAIKNARYLKERLNAGVYILNRDIRTVGKMHEEYYRKARAQGIKFVKYDPEKPPEVVENGDKTLKIKVYNEVLGREMTINCDMVVLSTPLIPLEDNKELSKVLKVPLDQSGFLLEAHVKLRPVDFATDGIYLCGTAHGPKDVADSISQALGAASRATIPLTLGKIKAEGATSRVDEELCIGCGRCVEVCMFDAISLEKNEKGEYKSRINDAICKGCGTCASVCPNSAITPRHFERAQILAMIDELLEA